MTAIIPHSLLSKRVGPRGRRGVALFELLVAFSLLAVVVSVSAGLVVRHGRLLTSARNQRLAIDELTNQMERLTAFRPDELAAFLAAPIPSPLVRDHLAEVTLGCTIDEPTAGDDERRVVLAIEWNEPGRRGNPLRLAGWLRGTLPVEVAP
ncbi:MAG: hypothetical protein DWH79_03480 [Planctomycetota bacterium]|nr:MAG: hypothetical protein DWH79_03480 [Planctomycetota bacterium]